MTFLWLLLFGVIVSCTPDVTEQRKQYVALELALDNIAAGQEPNWLDKLESAKQMSFDYAEVRDVQKLCVKAYEKYADALVEMENTRNQIATLEKSISTQTGAQMQQQHAKAKAAIDKTTTQLKQAETFVQQCTNARNRMKDKLGITRK